MIVNYVLSKTPTMKQLQAKRIVFFSVATQTLLKLFPKNRLYPVQLHNAEECHRLWLHENRHLAK